MPYKKKRPDKITRLKDLYDLSKPEDLFTLLPQEMEMMEARGMVHNISGRKKKSLVMEVLLELAKANGIDLDENMLSVFIDTIIDASKGKYGLNKVKP